MAGYSPSAGPVTSQGDPARKVNWQALNTTQSTGYDGGNEGVSQGAPMVPQRGVEANKSAANAASAQAGYRESSSWGGSQAAAQEYMGKLTGRQNAALQAGQKASTGFYGASQNAARQFGQQAGYLTSTGAKYQRFSDPAAASRMVGQQGAASDYLYRIGRGEAPSVAQMQMQQGQEQALASNLALAGSGRGGSSGAMLDQALRTNAAQQQQMVAQGAAQRAAEYQSALQTAAGIDASRFGQMDALAARGQAATGMGLGALGQQAALSTGAYSGASDIDLAYRGADRSTEDLIFNVGNEGANRYTSALTADQARALQRYMYDQDAATAKQNAEYAVYGGLASSAGQAAPTLFDDEEPSPVYQY